MAYSDEELTRIFDRSGGDCHICWGRLCFSNYGRRGARGAWEVEHSKARANGGSNHGNNLYAAHISCNRRKQAGSTRTARRANGKTRAPLSTKNRADAKDDNTVVGVAGGAVAGGLLLGPPGAVLGAIVGGVLGRSKKVQ